MPVLPGNPAQLSERAAGYLSSATRIAEAAAQLRGMTIPGDAAALEAVRLRAAHTATGLETAHGQYVAAATALADYATHLADAHHRAETAAQAIRYAQQQSTRAHDAALALRQRIDRLEDAGAPDSAIRTLTDQLWDAQHHARSADLAAASAHRDLTIARQDMNTAAETAMARIDAAMPDTTDAPPGKATPGPGKNTGPRTRTRLLLTALSSMSPSELRAHFTTHPEHLNQLRTLPPKEIAAWWASLAPPGTTGNSPTQTHLITTIPTLIGSLDGIPIHPRIQANQLNALHRLTNTHAELALVNQQLAGLLDSPPEHIAVHNIPMYAEMLQHRKTLLENERQYLLQVAEGTVKLYLYDPDSHQIAQAFGTPGPSTTVTNIYSPGTFTTMDSFYKDEVQQVARYLTRQNPEMFTVVWKGTRFPGETPLGEVTDPVTGIAQANSLDHAAESGRLIARLQEGLLLDPLLTDTLRGGIGHSRGGTNIYSAEMFGAEFDVIETLAGANIPDGWEAKDGVRYRNQTYDDALRIAQDNNVVHGIPPSNAPGVEDIVYTRPGIAPLHEHNLIASDDPANWHVLQRILTRIEETTDASTD